MGSLSPLTQYPLGNLPSSPYKGKETDSGTPDTSASTAPTNAEDTFSSPMSPTKKPSETTRFAGARSVHDPNIFKQFWEWLSGLFNGSARLKPRLNQNKAVYEKEAISEAQKKRNWTETLINTGIKIATIASAVTLAVAFRKSIASTFSRFTPGFIKEPLKRASGWVSNITPNPVKQGYSNATEFTYGHIDRILEKAPHIGKHFWNSFLKG